MTDDIQDFRIADFHIQLIFRNADDAKYKNGMSLLPSFLPFTDRNNKDEIFFQLIIDDSLKPIDKSLRSRMRTFDTGNGDTIVDEIKGVDYQYIIKNIRQHDCCLLETNKDFSVCRCALNGSFVMRTFGLTNALMLIFAFRGSFKQTVLMHASVIIKDGWGYAFTASSGTGKSTHTSLWLKYIKNTELLNDDNPIIRIIDNIPYVYGCPWSGKTPCYRNLRAPLGAVAMIKRDNKNFLKKLPVLTAYTTLLPAVSIMRWDKVTFDNVCNTIGNILENIDVFDLHCLPNKEAAIICQKSISKQKK